MADPTPWIVAEDHGDVRKHAPATLRNRGAIAECLRGILPPSGLVLEIASGSGEHAAYFAQEFPTIDWQPSDPDPTALVSIGAWTEGVANVRAPVMLDAAAHIWPIATADAVLCINMVHIAPWEATRGLLAGAAKLLAADAPLILYGPYRRAGVPTAESNEAFDHSLKARDPRWGLRDVEAVTAATTGFALDRLIEMPANNLILVYRRT